MIEILENGKWKDTGWNSLKHMEEYTGSVEKNWQDNEYNYSAVKFTIDNTLEIYRQKAAERTIPISSLVKWLEKQ